MRVLSKAPYVIGIIWAVALTASVADARTVKTQRLGGAHASVPAPRVVGGGTAYDAGGSPYPSGHGASYSSPDFQLGG